MVEPRALDGRELASLTGTRTTANWVHRGCSEEIKVVTAKIDQDASRAVIGDALKQTEENDPARLKARIRELEKQLKEHPTEENNSGQELVDAEKHGREVGYVDGYKDGQDDKNRRWETGHST